MYWLILLPLIWLAAGFAVAAALAQAVDRGNWKR
jgi:hypothetical protein